MKVYLLLLQLRGTLNLPGTIGGSEWGGAAYDPATHIIYVNGNECAGN